MLALYSGRNNASLNEICKIYDFPGKLDMDGGKVWETFLNGDLESIRNYCETDVANTYLVYLRYLLSKKELTVAAYTKEIDSFKELITRYKKNTLGQFFKSLGMKFKSKNLLKIKIMQILFQKILIYFLIAFTFTGCSEKLDENDINFGIAQKPQQLDPRFQSDAASKTFSVDLYALYIS